ncbi:MAG: hypothetical protein HY303_07210 [Candidatus Wallbacteria bacterium]|nr:hypothetical protein [Candidatus Wallbacteria bacterium]
MTQFSLRHIVLLLATGVAIGAGLAAQDLPKGHPSVDKAPASAAGSTAPAAEPAGSDSAAPAASAGDAGSGTSMTPPEPPQPAAPALKNGVLDLGEVSFAAPKDWAIEQPSSKMRKAQFKLPRAEGDSADGELAIFYFGPQSGSLEDNVQRWYGQFEQPDGSSTEKAAKREKAKAGSLDVTLIDLKGTMKASMMGGSPEAHPNYRMLGAIAETPSGNWYSKATGPVKTIEAASKAFREFALSVKAK